MSNSRSRVDLGAFSFNSGMFDPDISLTVDVFERSVVMIDVSIVMPIHNQAPTIVRNLEALCDKSRESVELILVIDGCTDDSEKLVRAFVKRLIDTALFPNVAQVQIVKSDESLYETICDSIGFEIASGAFLIEVQADMLITQVGFDRILVAPLRSYDDLFIVGGRGAHSFGLLRRSLEHGSLGAKIYERILAGTYGVRSHFFWDYNPGVVEHKFGQSVGRIAELVERPPSTRSIGTVFVHETVMRGPIAMRADVYRLVGGLDTESFFLGNDEHDLALRAWLQHGLRAAYTPIGFLSPLKDGSTRRERTADQQAAYERYSRGYRRRRAASFLVRNYASVGRLTRDVRRVEFAATMR